MLVVAKYVIINTFVMLTVNIKTVWVLRTNKHSSNFSSQKWIYYLLKNIEYHSQRVYLDFIKFKTLFWTMYNNFALDCDFVIELDFILAVRASLY